MAQRALILVDIQNDFMPTGALPVPKGDEVIAAANALLGRFELIVATQDWHPPRHGSFASEHEGRSPGELIDLNGVPQVLWPDHCVQGSGGAAFAEGLDVGPVTRVFQKGMDPEVDSYSGFFDNGSSDGERHATGLGDWLKERGVEDVFVCGVATDYCVKFTALDAAGLGFRTHLIEDACRGVELNEGNVEGALSELREAGVVVVSSAEV